MSSVRRSLWLSLADSYLALALQVVSTMIVSRVLTPAEVGVFAIAAVFSALASIFRDFGVSEYLIQERELTSDKIAAALALNITVSWAMAAAMFIGGPFAADFYKNQGVAEVMHVQAIGFLLVPFGAVTMAYFRRELNFRPVMICSVAGTVTSFVLSIGLVLNGFGYISLAWANVASIAVTVALSVWYRPKTFPRWPSLRGLADVFHFSKFVSLMYIISQAGKGMPDLIIGRIEGVVAVAMFSRGNGLVEMFNRLVMKSVFLVCMPYLAKSDREDGSMAQAYYKGVSYVTVVAWPFLALLGLAAFPAIRIMYGSQWDAAVPLAQALCLARALELVHVMSREALLARGLAKEANTLQTWLVVLQVLGVSLVVPYGLIGACWGIVASSVVGTFVSHHYLARSIGVRAAELVRACVPSATICALSIAPAAVWYAVAPPTAAGFLAFGIGASLLTVVAWLLAAYFLRHPMINELAPITRRLTAWRKPA